MTDHASVTDPDIHEPKGAAAASQYQILSANGSGGTSWAKLTSNNVDTTSILNVNKFKLYVTLDDVSTASFVLVPLPVNCTFNEARMVLSTGITSADSTLTFTNSTGPTSVGTKVIAYTASAEGTMFTFTASSNNTFTADTYLKIATDGASVTTSKLHMVLSFTMT